MFGDVLSTDTLWLILIIENGLIFIYFSYYFVIWAWQMYADSMEQQERELQEKVDAAHEKLTKKFSKYIESPPPHITKMRENLNRQKKFNEQGNNGIDGKGFLDELEEGKKESDSFLNSSYNSAASPSGSPNKGKKNTGTSSSPRSVAKAVGKTKRAVKSQEVNVNLGSASPSSALNSPSENRASILNIGGNNESEEVDKAARLRREGTSGGGFGR